jgi:ATP-dependent DNA helicase RecG
MKELKYFLKELRESDECETIEAKKGSEAGRSILETVCAFSNEPRLNGGYILLGVEKEEKSDSLFPDYIATGIESTLLDKIQSDLATQCATSFNIAIRPQIKIQKVSGNRSVVIVRVNEVSQEQKPVYFKNVGLPQGAYRRIGATDHKCTEDDMSIFYQNNDSLDKSVISDAEWEDIDLDAIEYYRKLRSQVNPIAEELSYDNRDLLYSLGAIKGSKNDYALTYTGILCFGKRAALRRLMPMMRIDYIRTSTNQWVQDPDKRFESTLDMRGSLLEMVQRVVHAVSDDLPRGFVLTDESVQAKNIGLPLRVLREAVVNALIHRSYRENRPIQIIRYPNRIEITNPGFSLKSEESLGEPGSETRNPMIAGIFHETNLAETKGSGIRIMRTSMEKFGMIPPTFESSREKNTFTIRLLLHHFLNDDDLLWLQKFNEFDLDDNKKRILIFVREVGAVDNLSARQINGTAKPATNADLKKMSNMRLLDQKGKNKFTYYVPGEKLIALLPNKNDPKEGFSTPPQKLSALPKGLNALPKELSALPKELSALPPNMQEQYAKIQARIDFLPQRVNDKQVIAEIICDLCTLYPMKLSELALFVHRTEKYIFRSFVKPLLRDKQITYQYPEMINHPEQAYICKPRNKEHENDTN